MSDLDDQTIAVYAAKVDDYIAIDQSKDENRDLQAFAQAMPEGGRVLDLGCGPGHAAAVMIKMGLDVDATDGTPEMVQSARQNLGVPARLETFSELDATDHYDGVFANFSLLHANKTAFPEHLAQIYAALKPGGILHLGMKTGTGERRDSLGRWYAYYTEAELEEHLKTAGFTDISVRRTGKGAGLSGSIDSFVIFWAHG